MRIKWSGRGKKWLGKGSWDRRVTDGNGIYHSNQTVTGTHTTKSKIISRPGTAQGQKAPELSFPCFSQPDLFIPLSRDQDWVENEGGKWPWAYGKVFSINIFFFFFSVPMFTLGRAKCLLLPFGSLLSFAFVMAHICKLPLNWCCCCLKGEMFLFTSN